MRPSLIPRIFAAGLLVGCVPPPPSSESGEDTNNSATEPDDSGPDSEAGGECGDLDCDQLDRSEDGYPAGPYGSEVGDRLENTAGVGLRDCDGNPVELKDFFGEQPDGSFNKGLLINLGAGWCGPCQEETLEFPELYEEYRDEGIEFIQVLFQTWEAGNPTMEFCEEWRSGDWPEGQVELDLAFPVVIDQVTDWSFDLLVNPESATPINMLLDANANIRFKREGELVPPATLRTQFDLVISNPYEIP